MKPLIVAVALIAILTVGYYLLTDAITRGERTECLSWQHDAKVYTNYYITHWQEEECAHYNITIDAPVQ
jgi:hypothetical protein